jgi:hypothetical protein
MRYLIGTMDLKLIIKPSSNDIVITSDADWANDREDRKSITGFVIYLFGVPVSWLSKKQTIIAKSSTAAEFIAADHAIDAAEVIRCIVDEITMKPTPTILKMDSTSAIARIKREGLAPMQKMVDIKFKSVKSKWQEGFMTITHLPTEEMPADLLTKALPAPALLEKRKLCALHAWMICS